MNNQSISLPDMLCMLNRKHKLKETKNCNLPRQKASDNKALRDMLSKAVGGNITVFCGRLANRHATVHIRRQWSAFRSSMPKL